MTESNGGIHPAIADYYREMNEALHERDKLQIELDETITELKIEKGKTAFLQQQLDKVTAERDYHMRLNWEQASRMSSIRSIMDTMFETAQHAADSKLTGAAEQQLLEAMDKDVNDDIDRNSN